MGNKQISTYKKLKKGPTYENISYLDLFQVLSACKLALYFK